MTLRHIALASLLTFAPCAALSAQTAKQDMKNAGSHTKSAAQDAGHGISEGSQKAYHKTKRGTKKAYHKTKNKVDGDPSTR